MAEVTPETSVGVEPDWLRAAVRGVRGELALYARTFAAFSLRPGASAAAWAEGQLHTLNPLAFLANTVAIMGPYRVLWARIFGLHNEVSIWLELAKPVLPFVLTISQALLTHALIRLGRPRRRAASSVAIFIYAAGGVPQLLQLVQWPLSMAALLRRPGPAMSLTLALFGLANLLLVFGITTAAMAGLHGVRWRRALLATLGSFGFTMVVMNLVPGGMRTVIQLLS